MSYSHREVEERLAHAQDTLDKTAEPDEGEATNGVHHDADSREQEPPPKPDLSAVAGDDDDEAAEKQEKPRQIDQLVRLVEDKAKLFHAPARGRYDFYADVFENGARKTFHIGSPSLDRRMLRWYRDRYSKALGKAVVDGANGMLRALAEDGPQWDVEVRTALHGGNYYIDIGDETWKAIEVTAKGWRIVDEPPVRFRRTGSQRALCVPKRGGRIDMLRPFLNVKDEDSFIMVVAWMLAALRPVGPYPVLSIHGEQGSAKSTMQLILKALVDPNAAPLRHANKDDRDLFISALNSWLLSFENISSLPGWFSDALCRLATGGGFTTRALYTDIDEVVFQSMRPIVMNGIPEFVERGDLADRSVFVHLQPIPDEKRKTTSEVLGELEKVQPLIFGALLDAMVTGLRKLPTTKLESKPRMADFAVWSTACEDDYCVNEGGFMDAYSRNKEAAVAGVIDADPVALAIRDFAHELGHKGTAYWEGTATELLPKLTGIVDEAASKERSWPKSAKSLGRHVARLAPVLRQGGIPLERHRRSGQSRTILIKGVRRADD